MLNHEVSRSRKLLFKKKEIEEKMIQEDKKDRLYFAKEAGLREKNIK